MVTNVPLYNEWIGDKNNGKETIRMEKVGPAKFSAENFRFSLPVILEPLLYLVNLLFCPGDFSGCLKHARGLPFAKGVQGPLWIIIGRFQSCQHWNESCKLFCKIVWPIIRRRQNDFWQTDCFRAHHDTTDALAEITGKSGVIQISTAVATSCNWKKFLIP